MINLETPLSESDIKRLHIGDIVYLSGVVYTARDRAHVRALSTGEFPGSSEGAVIFHAGPIVKKEKGKWKIIAVGPTTSSRMNSVEPEFIERFKVRAIVGKGGMDGNVRDSIKENNAVYLSMTGGCAASASMKVKEVCSVHWLDLGVPEAVWVLRIEGLGPLVVSIDSDGNSIYDRVDEVVCRNLDQLFH